MMNYYSKNQHLLPLNLQMFAEDTHTDAHGDPASKQSNVDDTKPQKDKPVNPNGDKPKDNGKPIAPKDPKPNTINMTQAEFDAEIAKRAERAKQKGFEEGKQAGADEATKLKDMTESEQKDYKIQQLTNQLTQEQEEKKKHDLVDQTSNMFSQAGLNVTTDEIASFFVGKDANETSTKYKQAVAMINRLVNEQRKNNIQGAEPKTKIDNSDSHLEDPVEIGKRLAKNSNSKEQSKWYMK